MVVDTVLRHAVSAARDLDRQAARQSLIKMVGNADNTPAQWRYLIELATALGEGSVAIESARHLARSTDTLQDRLLHCETLAEFRKEEQALALLRDLPTSERREPATRYLMGLLAAQTSDFEQSEEDLRAVIAAGVAQDAAWFTLSSVKRFRSGDPDLAAMEELAARIDPRDRRRQSRLGFAIAKARWDMGDHDEAFGIVSRAAQAQRSIRPFSIEEHERFVADVIAGFDAQAFASLVPSSAQGSRALFVTGLPRTGTTLAERLLSTHPDVTAGGEINLWGDRLFQTVRPTSDWARGIERNRNGAPVWKDLADHFHVLLWAEFPTSRYVVDKSLLQTNWMGLVLHAMPDARFVYVKRDLIDTAWSCFRTFFPQSLPWTNDLQDIARYMAADRALLDHWCSLFEDRILIVDHGDLVDLPLGASERMMKHFGLRSSEAMGAREAQAAVKTASMFQVRQDVDTRHATSSAPVREKILAELERGFAASPFGVPR